MNRRPRLVVLSLAMLMVLALAATGAAWAFGRTANGNGASDLQKVPALAPIDLVEVIVAESYPPQYSLRVVSGLPSGCVEFDRYEMERQGNTITVKIWNLVPADDGVACTMVYGMVEHNIALGSDFVSGETYTVLVNDVTETFVAQ